MMDGGLGGTNVRDNPLNTLIYGVQVEKVFLSRKHWWLSNYWSTYLGLKRLMGRRLVAPVSFMKI